MDGKGILVSVGLSVGGAFLLDLLGWWYKRRCERKDAKLDLAETKVGEIAKAMRERVADLRDAMERGGASPGVMLDSVSRKLHVFAMELDPLLPQGQSSELRALVEDLTGRESRADRERASRCAQALAAWLAKR